MLGQFFAIPATGGDRYGPCAEGLPAGDISRRVANDIDFVSGEFAAMLFLRAGPGKFAKLVSVVVVVGEGAELKKMPDAVVPELQLRSARDVARQKSEHEVLSGFQFLK